MIASATPVDDKTETVAISTARQFALVLGRPSPSSPRHTLTVMVESVYCASCGKRVWQGDFESVPPEIVGPDKMRTPCSTCGGMGRAHRRTISDTRHIGDSVTAKVTRGITSDRLGVLALFVGVLLGVWALAGLLW